MLRFLLTTLAVLALAAPASAQQCEAPAGTGAVDQYCEVVPGSKGERDANPGVGVGGEPTLPNDTSAVLTGAGKDGEALTRALGGDPAATPGAKQDGRPGPASRAGSVSVPDAPSSNPFTAVTEAVAGNETLSSPFFLALFGIVAAMLGCAWVGWRRDRAA